MKKFVISLITILGIGLGLIFMTAGLTGCAAMNYGPYTEAQKEVYIADANAKGKAYDAIGSMLVNNPNTTPEQQMIAVLSIVLLEVASKSHAIEAPREGTLERAVGSALTVFAGLGGAALILNQVGEVTGNVNVDNGSSYNGGSGTGSSNTSVPTVVEQPAPIVFMPE